MAKDTTHQPFSFLDAHLTDRLEGMDCWSPEAEEALEDLLRALRRKKGFGLFFVQCNPAQGGRVIAAIQQRFPQKRLVKVELNRESETLYGELLEAYQQEPFHVACITGVEQALYGYEDTKRLAGWTSEEIYNYSWKGLPPLLNHLNRQRESFEANLPIALIFLVQRFVIDYFVQRAPDFFDWRSGFFVFSENSKEILNSCHELVARDYEEYLLLTSDQRMEKILSVKDRIQELGSEDDEQKSDLLREQGRLFESGTDFERALDCYDRALAISPENHTTWNSRGSVLCNLDRHEEAIESYKRALCINPDYYYAWKSIGDSLRFLERFEEAVKRYDDALNVAPDCYCAWSGKGMALGSLGRYEESIASHKHALELNQSSCYTWGNIGDNLRFLERFEDAIESYKRALEINSEYYYAWKNVGDSLHSLERYEEAIENYDKALPLSPDDYYTWNNRGAALKALSRYEEAVESFKRALEINPEFHYAWANIGGSLESLERYEEAIENYDKALSLNPDDCQTLNNKGYLLYRLSKHQEAADCLAKVTELQPENQVAWNNQGFLTLADNSYGSKVVFEKPLLIRQSKLSDRYQGVTNVDPDHCEQSITLFDKALSMDSTFILAWANRSFPAYYLQQYETALESCDRALALDSDNQEDMNDVIYSNRGCILLKLNDPTGALQAFAAAIELNPELDEAWNGHGNALYQLGRYAKAAESFAQALKLKHPLALANLALAQQHL